MSNSSVFDTSVRRAMALRRSEWVTAPAFFKLPRITSLGLALVAVDQTDMCGCAAAIRTLRDALRVWVSSAVAQLA